MDSTRFTYDVADRVIGTVSYGPARPYTLPLNTSFSPDTAQVVALTRTDSSAYDKEGNLTFKKSLSSSGQVQLTENLTYDAAGRLTKRSIGTGPDSMIYDPAGNLISARHRSGKWVTQSFDVLNRLTTRVVPDTIYNKGGCSAFAAGPLTGPSCLVVFPYYPNSGTSMIIPADTSRFVYDAFGNMTEANNLYARVRRSYYRDGTIKTDSTALGSYAAPLTDEYKFGQIYNYDLSGRRTSMVWALGTNSYSYNDFGALSSLTDGSNTPYRFVYNLAGQLESLILGTGVREKEPTTLTADASREKEYLITLGWAFSSVTLSRMTMLAE